MTPQQLLANKDAIQKALCERSFYHFMRYAWPSMDASEFIDGWHLRVICSELEKVARGEPTHRNSVFNIPPRHGKSLLISVAFPAWIWTWWPKAKFLATSYAAALSIRDSVKMRRLIESPWYQRLWGDKVVLVHDQNQKQYYETTEGGHRFATSVGGLLTGQGADFILCLPYDAIVRTENGEEKIGDVVENKSAQYVLAYDHDSDQAAYKRILDFEKNPGRELIEIEIDDGKVLRCTCDHPVYVVSKGYIRADMIEPNDEVIVCQDACID